MVFGGYVMAPFNQLIVVKKGNTVSSSQLIQAECMAKRRRSRLELPTTKPDDNAAVPIEGVFLGGLVYSWRGDPRNIWGITMIMICILYV